MIRVKARVANDFAGFVAEYRYRHHLGQAEAAPILGVHEATLRYWELGKRLPHPRVREWLAERLADGDPDRHRALRQALNLSATSDKGAQFLQTVNALAKGLRVNPRRLVAVLDRVLETMEQLEIGPYSARGILRHRHPG